MVRRVQNRGQAAPGGRQLERYRRRPRTGSSHQRSASGHWPRSSSSAATTSARSICDGRRLVRASHSSTVGRAASRVASLRSSSGTVRPASDARRRSASYTSSSRSRTWIVLGMLEPYRALVHVYRCGCMASIVNGASAGPSSNGYQRRARAPEAVRASGQGGIVDSESLLSVQSEASSSPADAKSALCSRASPSPPAVNSSKPHSTYTVRMPKASASTPPTAMLTSLDPCHTTS